MTLVKICGLTSVEDAMQVAAMDVDLIGLVFAESHRRISVSLAAEITAALKNSARRPMVTGVFVNENPEVVNRTAEACSLDLIQLSGDEDWGYCRHLIRPLIRVIHIMPHSTARQIIATIDEGCCAGMRQPFICLLDSRHGARYGGTGQTFDWDVAAEVAATHPVIIGGGLSAANVKELIRRMKPAGVDVSTGVETDGRKDMLKIREFVDAAKSEIGYASTNPLTEYLLKDGKYVT